jgi:putative acetyltransferase
VIIREYDEVDLDDVLAIWERASRIAHFFLGEDFLRRERDSVANIHPRLAQTWVCVKGATIVGFIALVGNQVGGLFVDPAFQGEGIGRLLVDHARSLTPSSNSRCSPRTQALDASTSGTDSAGSMS